MMDLETYTYMMARNYQHSVNKEDKRKIDKIYYGLLDQYIPKNRTLRKEFRDRYNSLRR